MGNSPWGPLPFSEEKKGEEGCEGGTGRRRGSGGYDEDVK